MMIVVKKKKQRIKRPPQQVWNTFPRFRRAYYKYGIVGGFSKREIINRKDSNKVTKYSQFKFIFYA